MKIRIKSKDHNLRFCFPTRLIFNKTVAKIANITGRYYAHDAMTNIPPEALERLFDELARIKKRSGAWELVKIESSQGENIEIIL